MAAVTSGTVKTTTYQGTTYLQLDWTQVSQSSSGTTISWTLKGYDDPYVQWEVGPIHAYINGTCVYSFEIQGSGNWNDREGRYQFNGWTDLGSGSITIPHESDGTKSFVAEVTATVCVHGTSPNISGSETFELTQIAPPTTVVEYVGNGGIKLPNGETTYTTTATYGQKYTIAPLALFSRSGYECVGWTTNSDGTDDGYNWTNWTGTWVYTDGYGISSGKLTLYARWEPLSYILTYNGNGGKLIVDSEETEGAVSCVDTLQESVTYGVTKFVVKEGEGFCIKEGSKFLGWIDDKGIDWTPLINQEQTWEGENCARNVILYAQWDNNVEYSVTFDLNGGTSDEGEGPIVRIVQSGGSAIPPSNVTKSGKQFKGWAGTYTNVTSSRTIHAIYDGAPLWIMTADGWRPFKG